MKINYSNPKKFAMGLAIGNAIGIPFGGASQSWESYVLEKISTFKSTLQTNGIWDKLDLINLGFAGESAFLNLKDDTVVAALSSETVSFLEDKVGFFTNGFSGYIDYNWNPSTVGNNYSLNSAYFAVYNWLPIIENGFIAGCFDASGYLTMCLSRNNNLFRYRINMGSSEKTFSYTGDMDGYFSLRKTDNTVVASRNGTPLNTSTITTVAIPDQKIRGLANNGGDASVYSPSFVKLGAIIAGAYLTEAEDLILSTALSTLKDEISDYPEYYDSGNVRYVPVGVNNKNVLYVAGDNIFAVSSGLLWLSTDGGNTWVSKALATALNVDFVHIFDSGTIVFAVKDKIYRSTDSLANIHEITPKLPGGADYTIHTPANATYPGQYYRLIGPTNKMYRGTDEIFIWGNYGNVIGGASPINIYELSNDGANLTVIYQFGQNPYYRDNGTMGGGSTGNLLGDAGNDTKVRHVHSVIWDEDNSTVYFCTGDKTQVGPFNECLWGKLVYSEGAYTPTIIVSDSEHSNYKSCGLNLINGEIYYACDTVATVFGIWKTTIANIANSANHIQLLNEDAAITGLVRDGNNLIANMYQGELKVYLSKDLGATWDEVQLTKVPGYPNYVSMLPIGIKDSDGYIWYSHNYNSILYTLKIKIKVI